MSVLKDVRFVSMVLLVTAAVCLIAVPTLLNVSSITVDQVLPESKCIISEGAVINQIYSTVVKDRESYLRALENIKDNDRVTMVVNGAPFGCDAIGDGDQGIEVKENLVESLRFGIDIQGGTRVVLKPVEDITPEELSNTVKTLENRINFFGLREVKVNTLGSDLIQIEMSGSTGDEIRDFLAKQGKFEGKLSYQVRLSDGEGTWDFGGVGHDIELQGDRVNIGNGSYRFNDTFSLDGESFQIISVSNNSMLIYADLFQGEDIVSVLTDSQNSAVVPVGDDVYEFTFGVQVSKAGADRFAKLTKEQEVVRTDSKNSYIGPKLVLFLDDRVITELNIASTLAGQPITTAVISGTETGLEGATFEKLRLESTLRSGSLPVKLEIEKVDTITETAGKDLINSTIFVALASVIAVSSIVMYRYRDYQIVVPMVVISLLEVLIVVGMAASQAFAGVVIFAAFVIGIWKREVMGMIGWITLFTMILVASTVVMSPWTIDIPVIAGLIAILGTGVNQMIIMTDQIFREKGSPLYERHRAAMNIIWSSAATVVFAMIPLILGGIGTLKGFAIATIVGILVGILITRPAYIALIEKIKHVKLEPGKEGN